MPIEVGDQGGDSDTIDIGRRALRGWSGRRSRVDGADLGRKIYLRTQSIPVRDNRVRCNERRDRSDKRQRGVTSTLGTPDDRMRPAPSSRRV